MTKLPSEYKYPLSSPFEECISLNSPTESWDTCTV